MMKKLSLQDLNFKDLRHYGINLPSESGILEILEDISLCEAYNIAIRSPYPILLW
jgi:hypothetical protein